MYGTSCFTKSSPLSSSLRSFSSPTSEAQRRMAFRGESAVPCAACSGRHQPTNSARKGRSARGMPEALWLLCSSCNERRPGKTTSFQGVYEGRVISRKGFQSSVSAMRKTDSGTKLRQLRKGPSAPMPLPQTKMWSRPPVRLKKCRECTRDSKNRADSASVKVSTFRWHAVYWGTKKKSASRGSSVRQGHAKNQSWSITSKPHWLSLQKEAPAARCRSGQKSSTSYTYTRTEALRGTPLSTSSSGATWNAFPGTLPEVIRMLVPLLEFADLRRIFRRTIPMPRSDTGHQVPLPAAASSLLGCSDETYWSKFLKK
mmetsp:Transcript_91946/g.286614  ORF Transcript_91946/g.286614 Transcript_91946/m.286614 type:complete len:314 (+) Transcript_91946:522-1463(+)